MGQSKPEGAKIQWKSTKRHHLSQPSLSLLHIWTYGWKMSLFAIVLFLCGLGASQSIAGWVMRFPWKNDLTGVFWAFVAQYAVCFLLLMFIDHASLSKAIPNAFGLVVFVQIFYFLKNLKKDG